MTQFISGYEKEFHDALERTDTWGLCAPYFKPSERRLLDEKGQQFAELLQKTLGKRSAEEVSQQCFAVTYFLQEELEALFGTQLTFTLGYVELKRHKVFYTPEAQLKNMLGTPISMRSLNLHAWLTSPSYEIIDLTFGTTYGVEHEDPSCIGQVIAQHHSKFDGNLIHHPQVIGEDFLVEIGGIAHIQWG